MVLSPRFDLRDQSYVQLDAIQEASRQRILGKLRSGEWACEETRCFCEAPPGKDLLIAKTDRYGIPLDTWLCEHCGILRSSPRLDARSTEEFYRTEYRTLYTAAAPDHEQLFLSQLKIGTTLANQLEPQIGQVKRVFEVGCGAGGILKGFAAPGRTLAGVDYGEDALQVGIRNGLDLIAGDARSLLAARGQADLVIAWHVVEHFLDLRSELAALHDLVADDGMILVGVPGIEAIPQYYRSDLMHYLQNAHNHHFCAATLALTLTLTGFKVFSINEQCTALARKANTISPKVSFQEVIPNGTGFASQVLSRLTQFEAALETAAA